MSAEDWTTEDGKTYKNVTVVGQEDDGVRITYDGGVGKVPYYELPADLQKRFGQDVDSLAAKKRAVDQAISDAVSAAATQSVVLPNEVPMSVPPPQPPPGVAPTVPGSVPQNTAPGSVTPGSVAPGSAGPAAIAPPGTVPMANTPGASAPGVPGVAPTNTPGKPTPGTAVTPGTAIAPGTAPRPGGAPGNPTAANHPGAGGGKPAGGGAFDNVDIPSLDIPSSHTPQPTGINAAKGKPLELAVANYSYNEALDVCYLDSPPIEIYPGPLTGPQAQSSGSSLTLRTVTDGHTPQIPDRFEMTLLCVGSRNTDLGAADTNFNAGTGTITVDPANRKDSGSLPGGNTKYASFYLSSADVRQICSGQPLTFTVGDDSYHIDARGARTLQGYLADTDSLAPATSSLLYNLYKMLGRIPSFFSIISTICEYVILGSFALLVAASIAAFILGISRFIKM